MDEKFGNDIDYISGLSGDSSKITPLSFSTGIERPVRLLLSGAISGLFRQASYLSREIQMIHLERRNESTFLLQYADRERTYVSEVVIPMLVLGDVIAKARRLFESRKWPQDIRDDMLRRLGEKYRDELLKLK